MMYGGFAEKLWDDAAEMRSDLESTQVKVAFLFGSMDPLFQDHYDSNMEIWKVMPDCRFTVLNGECHLMELDAPERVVAEVFIAIDESKKSY